MTLNIQSVPRKNKGCPQCDRGINHLLNTCPFCTPQQEPRYGTKWEVHYEWILSCRS